MADYGKEVIIDLHNCDPKLFTRKSIENYFIDLCELIDMKREDLHWWDYDGQPEEYAAAPAHLKGISAIQFIQTSNITIHTLDELKQVYLNIFSCKDFDARTVIKFTRIWFNGVVKSAVIVRRR